MTRRIFYFLIFLLFFVFPTSAGSQNPFTAPVQQQEKKEPSFTPLDFMPGWVKYQGQKAMAKIVLWQALIRQKAATYARRINANPWGGAFWSYLGLAFAYGVIHALGPGHGKVFVSTYFLSRKASVSQGILMGGFMSFLHVFSAVILVFLFYFVLKAGGLGAVDETGKYMQKITAGIISIVGLFLVWKSSRSIFRGRVHGSGCWSGEADRKSLLSLSLAVGLVPCPGAALILFFSITLGILPVGMLAMVFLAAGLALTTIFFALASIFAGNMLAAASGRIPGSLRIYHITALMGGVVITFLGAVMFVSQPV